MPAVYGTKVGMTRVYDGDVATPVTVVEVLPNDVLEVKEAGAGAVAVKVACGPSKRKIAKPLAGEYKKAGVEQYRQFLREVPAVDGVEAGGQVTVAVLDPDKPIDVIGTSKGRGFAGVMKRHNFGGHRATHGTQKHRGPGSIGCRMDPGKVFKNKRMAGHFGVDRVTVRNLAIVSIDTERHLVAIRGSVPGPNGGLVCLRQA